MGNLRLSTKDTMVYVSSPSHYLLSFDKLSIPVINLPKKAWSKIMFDIGVDSITHEKAEIKGDLDPIYGMYWAWQSGYIQIKIEGNYLAKNQNPQAFQFHIGGTYAPFNTLQTLQLNLDQTDTITIPVALDEFFMEALSIKPYRVMSPKTASITLSKKFSNGILTQK
jgi:hypothetical protein